MTTTLLGREVGEWASIGRSMEKRGIRNARQLEDRLKRGDKNEGRVEVRDSKNPDRLLGSMNRPSMPNSQHDRLRVACLSRISASPFDYRSVEMMEASISTVDFALRSVGWNVVLTTDASLELLVRIDGFRLPGESEEQAHVRNMYAR